MPRGGKRAGTGRKPALPSATEELRVGARIDQLWGKEVAKAEAQALAASTKHARAEWDKVQDIPVKDREKWAFIGKPKSHGSKRRKTQAFEYHIEDVKFARQQDRRNKGRAKRPWGVQEKIIKQVAAEFGISENKALECLKEFRRVGRKLLSDV